MPNDKSLAEDAVDTYDNAGEAQLLQFIHNHIDPRPAGLENNPCSLMVLQDHTAVLATADNYIFLWTNHPGYTSMPYRARRLNQTPLPTPSQTRPLNIGGALHWNSLMYQTLKVIETNVRLSLGHSPQGQWLTDDPPMDEKTVRLLAPSLIAELNKQALETIEQDAIYDLMDTLAIKMVQDALESTDASERASLATAMMSAVQSRDQEVC